MEDEVRELRTTVNLQAERIKKLESKEHDTGIIVCVYVLIRILIFRFEVSALDHEGLTFSAMCGTRQRVVQLSLHLAHVRKQSVACGYSILVLIHGYVQHTHCRQAKEVIYPGRGSNQGSR